MVFLALVVDHCLFLELKVELFVEFLGADNLFSPFIWFHFLTIKILDISFLISS